MRSAARLIEYLSGSPEAQLCAVCVGLDDHSSAQPSAQAQDLRLEERLILLGDVILGVLLQVAEFTCRLDALRYRTPTRRFQVLEFRFELS